MKYIRELVKKLPILEFQKLSKASFSKTELALINHYRNDTKDELESTLSNQFGVKESTLKKIQSSLLIKSIEMLSTKSIFDQITFLSNTNCHKILIHLAKKEIVTLKKKQKTEVLKKLILEIPYSLLSAIVTDYSKKDLELLEREYLKLENQNSKSFTKLRIFLLILEIYQYDNWSKARMNKLKKEIDKINTHNDLELTFWKNKLLGDYYHNTDEEKYMNMLKANYDLLNSSKVKLPINLEINNKLQYCFYLIYKNKFQETYDYYNKMKVEYPNEISGKKGLRYVDLISQVCIVLGKYEEAKEYILKAYPIEKEKPGQFSEIYFGNTTVLAMLDILDNDMDLAFARIRSAKNGLKKQYFLFLDSLLRLTEQAYYFKIGDYDFADTLYQKNIKFYQYHNMQDLEIMDDAHKIIQAYCKQIFETKALSSKLSSSLEALKKGEFAFVGHFIEKLNPNLVK